MLQNVVSGLSQESVRRTRLLLSWTKSSVNVSGLRTTGGGSEFSCVPAALPAAPCGSDGGYGSLRLC